MKIGIPKGFGFYEYPVLFETFFKNLGFDIVYSNNTSDEILKAGLDNSLSESCLASKIFIGHVANLVKRKKKEKIDYIFIPRLCNFENSQTTCVKLYGIYDICNNVFDCNFITLNIDYQKKAELRAFLELGKKLNINRRKTIRAYLDARKKQNEYDKNIYLNQLIDIKSDIKKENEIKILIVAHPYVLYDEFLGKRIIRILENNKAKVFFSNINSFSMANPKILRWKKEKNSYLNISDTIFWKSSKNLLNGIIENINNVDGIVYLSVFPCGTDSLVNELAIRRINNIPSINLVLDEQDSDAGIHTRIESFLDILEMNKENKVV